MAARRPGLARQRKAVGFSQEELAEHLGVERSTVVRWEAGETEPQPQLRPRIARALQVSLAHFDELLRCDVGSTGRSGLDHLPAPPAGADLITVAEVRDEVQRLDAKYDHLPSAALLATAGQCLGQVVVLGEHARNVRIRRELRAVEAEAAVLMGQLVWDASQRRDHGSARAYFDQAITAARRSRDPVPEGFALLRKSFVALYGEKDARAGLDLTTEAGRVARRFSDVVAGLATLHSAEAYAMLGQRRECERALSDAETSFGRVRSDDPAIDIFSPAHFGRLAGSCYLFLGNAGRAQPMLEGAARDLRDRSKSRAIAVGNVTLAFIRQGKVEAAITTLHTAIDLIQQNWGGGGLNIVFTAARELRVWWNLPVVRDVHDRLLTLMTAAPGEQS